MQFNKIIIWGLRKKWHTHRFIHKAFYENAKKLGYKVIWVEDEKGNAKYVEKGDLVIFSEVQGKMVPEKSKLEDYNLPIVEGVYYCLHNVKDIFSNNIDKKYLLKLNVYLRDAENKEGNEKWREGVIFNKLENSLYQPWGTDILDYEFKKPVFRKNKFVFWIGSVWNNNLNQGNFLIIENLKKILEKKNIKFIKLRFIPDWMNIFFIRLSKIAPAIVGAWQEDHDYLPCRMFKNISYGHVGFTNVKKFNDILGDFNIKGDIEEVINTILDLDQEEYKSLVLKQQAIVKQYTYKNALENIFRGFDNINI